MAKILFLTARFPHPLDKGDKLRAFNQIKHLSLRHEVHVACLNEHAPRASDLEALHPHCASITNLVVPRWRRAAALPLALFNGLPFQVQYFRSARVARAIQEMASRVRPDVVHCHLLRMAPYVRRSMAPRITLDYMDCFSTGALREASWGPWPKSVLLRMEHRRLCRYERKAAHDFDGLCIISPEDRSQLPIDGPERVLIVANGVDRSTFHPLARAKHFDILFTGHMGYPPNIAAALFLVHEVLPLIRQKLPQVRVLIAGIGAPTVIRALNVGGVTVNEKFDHIREAFAMSRVLLAPMRISIGLQNKILQAMAMDIPVVTTT
jgi:polysaccharide biosynthesis protein PslH